GMAFLGFCGTASAAGMETAEADNNADLRCLAAAAAAANTADRGMQVAATISTMYWLGRLEGRKPNFDLERHLTATAQHMNEADLKAETVRCGELLRAKGLELQTVGQHMTSGQSTQGL